MSQGIINVTLNRDGSATPWGFRLHGGKDIGYPLTIQRVFLGSPSERELQRGDILLGVNDHDATDMTHMEAHDVIKSAGNQLRLVAHRLPGAPQSPFVSSPAATTNTHPLANAISAAAKQPTRVQSPTSKVNQPFRNTTPQVWSPPPLPKSSIPTSGFQPSNAPRYQDTEKNKPKTTVNQPYFMQNLPSRTFSPSSGVASPLLPSSNIDDNAQLVNLQYNSPLGLYSKEAVAETIKAQTSMQPKNRPKSPLPAINTKQIPVTNQDNPVSPTATTPGALAKPGTKLTNIVDITLSPTFQMIQEAENRSSSPKPEVKAPSPQMMRTQQVAPARILTGYQDPTVNAFGASRETIHQSGSFKTLMATLALTGNQDL